MRSFPVTDVVRSYAVAHGSWRPDSVVRELQAETAELGDVAGMQIGDDQGQLLTMLVRLTGARRAVEVGTFTGYSSMCIARGLAEGGSLLCCDVSAEWTEIGRRAWASAGLADRIELRSAPGAGDLAGAARGGRHRPGFHRCGQARLCRLLGRAGATGPPRGTVARGQRSVERADHRSRGHRREHHRVAGLQRPGGLRRARRCRGPDRLRWTDHRPTAVTLELPRGGRARPLRTQMRVRTVRDPGSVGHDPGLVSSQRRQAKRL